MRVLFLYSQFYSTYLILAFLIYSFAILLSPFYNLIQWCSFKAKRQLGRKLTERCCFELLSEHLFFHKNKCVLPLKCMKTWREVKWVLKTKYLCFANNETFSLMLIYWLLENTKLLFKSVHDPYVSRQAKLYLTLKVAGGLCINILL